MDAAVADPQLGLSAYGSLAQLKSALQATATSPHDENVARSLLVSAKAVSNGLNQAAILVDNVRVNANADIQNGAKRLTDLLSHFEVVNARVIDSTTLGRDATEQIDKRNSLLRDISQLIDVHSSIRGSQDMVLFVANGTTLFETVPRKIALDTSVPLPPGGALRIDGIPFVGAQGEKLGGELGGALQVRDVIAASFGRQLDEVARGLVEAFAESDQSAVPTAPVLAGLFTYSGGPAVPTSGVVVEGMARSLKVNPNVDPSLGGNLGLLRDGGISAPGDPRYSYNSSGAAGFSDRLRELALNLAAPRAFDTSVGIGSNKSVFQLAADSAGWLESERSSNDQNLKQQQVLSERAAGAWHSAVGVNLDDELTTLMSLEKSFQASSRLISTVSTMFDALLQMAR